MKKLLIISPHFSTGGCPQVILNKIELLKDAYEILCVEYDFLSSDFVIQRNKVIGILGDNFISLGDNKKSISTIISRFNPDVISIEEFPENFMNDSITEMIYKKYRTYTILETTHSSVKCTKRFLPDKFIFVSKYSDNMYKSLGVDSQVIEYPIDKKYKDVVNSRNRLNFDPEYKHIVNVGLFTQGKNQGYAFELARILKDNKIIFHFVGNQAGNFQDYWGPIMKNKPDNCVIHGERSDVEDFLMASDVFLFTSKFELNPLVVKEALSYDMNILMFNLDTYCNSYNNMNTISFLTGDLIEDSKRILKIIYTDMTSRDIIPESKEEFVFDDRNKLPQFLNKLGLINNGVEVGSFKGTYAKTILDNWAGKLYMVDVWRPLSEEEYDDSSNHKDHLDAYSETMNNISGFEDRAFMLRMKSEDGSKLFNDNSLDFVYIDANHTYQAVKDDIEYWYSKVKIGGLLLGHDYIPSDLYKDGQKDIPLWLSSPTSESKYAGMFGVNTAVDEFAFNNGYEVNKTNEFLGTWWIVKKENNIEDQYKRLCNISSDINLHLPKLKEYADKCYHVTEIGVRGCVSLHAFLASKTIKVVGIDIVDVPVPKSEKLQFICASSLDITIETDFLFIDSLHTYDQLKQELNLHAKNVSKYIGFHDTESFGTIGEDGGKGLNQAIDEFLFSNKEWVVDYSTTINNGLKIIKRI